MRGPTKGKRMTGLKSDVLLGLSESGEEGVLGIRLPDAIGQQGPGVPWSVAVAV